MDVILPVRRSRQSISHYDASNTLVKRTGQLGYDLSNFSITGDSLIGVSNSSLSTFFTALKDCQVNIYVCSPILTIGNVIRIYRNDILVSGSSFSPAANFASNVSANFSLNAGDNFYFETTSEIVNNGDISTVSISAIS